MQYQQQYEKVAVTAKVYLQQCQQQNHFERSDCLHKGVSVEYFLMEVT